MQYDKDIEELNGIYKDFARIFDIESSKIIWYNSGNKVAKFDLTLNALENEDTISLSFDYCTKLFKNERVEKMSEEFISIIVQINNEIDILINDILVFKKFESGILMEIKNYDFKINF